MDWLFAPNNGGRDSGLNDAGVETFNGNFDRYLARELIQNSLDARLDTKKKPVHVKFEVISLARREVPGMDRLQGALDSCAKYWRDDSKAHAFFQNAAKLASMPRLKALRVSDYNTSGVPGSDIDRKKNWYHLVRCAGSSSKSSGEGGSFGIGKNAPFAASDLRTVLYSTLAEGGEHAFQGVSMLASHQLAKNTVAQPTGFLGGPKGESIRNPNKIPAKFRRTERGLDIVALGFPAGDSWQDDLVHSVLENFWPAINFGDLVVTVGGQAIDRSTLPGLMVSFSGREEFTAHFYYSAFKEPSQRFEDRLPNLKTVSLDLRSGEPDLPKKVAMVRKTGMVIYQRSFRSILPFCGVFMCRNDDGNKLLREMEPPRHDTWDPNHPSKGKNKKTEAEYLSFIRDCIKKLIPQDDSKVIAIPGLNRFLPDDDDSPEESFDAADEASKEESLDRTVTPQKVQGKRIDPGRKSMQPDHLKFGEDEDLAEGGEGDGNGGGLFEDEGNGGGGGGGGGKGVGSTGTEAAENNGAQAKPAVPIRYRTFVKDVSQGLYEVILKGEAGKSAEVNLVLYIVGDDQKVAANLKGAKLNDGTPVAVSDGGLVGPLKLGSNQTLRLEIALSEALRVAMEVAAHEA